MENSDSSGRGNAASIETLMSALAPLAEHVGPALHEIVVQASSSHPGSVSGAVSGSVAAPAPGSAVPLPAATTSPVTLCRLTLHWADQPPVSLLLTDEQRALFVEWLSSIKPGQGTFRTTLADGAFVSAHLSSPTRFSARVVLATHVAGWIRNVVPAPILAPLRELLALPSCVWLVGETGLEAEVALGLIGEATSTLVRLAPDMPLPYACGVVEANTALAEAMVAKQCGGYEQLLYCGALTATELPLLIDASRCVVAQRAKGLPQAIMRSRLASQPDTANQLADVTCAIELSRDLRGQLRIQTIYELVAGADGLQVNTIAQLVDTGRGQQELQWVRLPAFFAQLAAAGSVLVDAASNAEAAGVGFAREDEVVENEVDESANEQADEAVDEEVNHVGVDDLDSAEAEDLIGKSRSTARPPNDVLARRERAMATMRAAVMARRAQASRAPYTSDSSGGSDDDPGWELDVSEQQLVSAPGEDAGLYRARPMVRPAVRAAAAQASLRSLDAPSHGDIGEVEDGKLTLDAPRRGGKVIIQEAPGGLPKKRSFADILRDRHRYPPVSSDGSPTLTPPVVGGGSGLVGGPSGEVFDSDEDDFGP